ncbi:MAG TPA: alpha/beta fold hydrolase [Gammaproteobacteria bacterium]|nr:alpha/beta fold hydrolase [Gammaproteobacteria bacterium]
MAETVVFVHGLYMVGAEFGLLRRRLDATGFATRLFHYHSLLRSVDENAMLLADHLKGVDVERLHLVGHSLGGMVILRMFQRGVTLSPGRVVFLGSPVRGSQAAQNLKERGWGFLLGRSGPEGLTLPHEATWTEPRELGVIAGTHRFSLNPFHPELSGPHDGMVSVEETRIAGATDSIELHLAHTTMLFSSQLAEQVNGFLKEGKFLR